MQKSDHYHAAKTAVGFMAFCLVAGLFFYFYNNQAYLTDTNQLKVFIALAIIGAGLLITLFYLASKPAHKHKTVVHKAVSHKTLKRKKTSKK